MPTVRTCARFWEVAGYKTEWGPDFVRQRYVLLAIRQCYVNTVRSSAGRLRASCVYSTSSTVVDGVVRKKGVLMLCQAKTRGHALGVERRSEG